MNVISKKGTYIKDNNSTSKMMRNLFIALIPIMLFSFYKNGYLPYSDDKTGVTGLFYPLMFIAIPALTSFITELLWTKLILKKNTSDLITYMKSSFSIFPGLFLGLVLPINTPILIVILGSIFATVIGKLLFGGFGNNIFNPALVGALFITSTFSLVITNHGGYLNPSEIDAVTSATPLSHVVDGIGSYATLVKPYGSLLNFFIGTIPGSVGETSALLCLLGFIYLTIKKVIKPIIPISYILTVFIITLGIGLINNLGIWYPLFQILSGGLMFGAIFMATDPVTSPTTRVGQWIFGILLGILTVIFRFLTPFPEGVLTSILTMNMFVVLLDRIGFKARFNKNYILVPLLILISLIALLSISIGKSYIKEEVKTFTIISKETANDVTTYIVTSKGYSSTIKAEIKLTTNKIISYKILEEKDSFYSKVQNSNFTDKLINNQNSLSTVDTVTGATITSSAIKKLLIDVVNDYTNNKGFTITEESKEEPINTDTDFNIISTVPTDNSVIYTISKEGFMGTIKLEVTTIDKVITNIEVLEVNDSYFSKIYESDYINQIINNQNNLLELDTVSGATMSSTALKDAITKLIDYINTQEVSNENPE